MFINLFKKKPFIISEHLINISKINTSKTLKLTKTFKIIKTL